jgi:hypothetical protein
MFRKFRIQELENSNDSILSWFQDHNFLVILGDCSLPQKKEKKIYVDGRSKQFIILSFPNQRSLKSVMSELLGLRATITPIKLNRKLQIIHSSRTAIIGDPTADKITSFKSEGYEIRGEKNSILNKALVDKFERECEELKREIKELQDKLKVQKNLQHRIVMDSMARTFKSLIGNKINLEKVLSLPSEQREMVFNEINYAHTCHLPSPFVNTFKNWSMNDKEQAWLESELLEENLIVGKMSNHVNNREKSQLQKRRYASETLLDLNNQLEVLKYSSTKETRKEGEEFAPNSTKKLHFIDLKIKSKTIRLQVLSNWHTTLFAKNCMKLITKEQRKLRKEAYSDSSIWFFCSVLDVNAQHFYVILVNLTKLSNSSKGFRLRQCTLDSLQQGLVTPCMSELQKLFLDQKEYLNEIGTMKNIQFGKNFQQTTSFNCSHHVISNLEWLLRANEQEWTSLDCGEGNVLWNNVRVTGGYYASKLLRILVLNERATKGDLKNRGKIRISPDEKKEEEEEEEEKRGKKDLNKKKWGKIRAFDAETPQEPLDGPTKGDEFWHRKKIINIPDIKLPL